MLLPLRFYSCPFFFISPEVTFFSPKYIFFSEGGWWFLIYLYSFLGGRGEKIPNLLCIREVLSTL